MTSKLVNLFALSSLVTLLCSVGPQPVVALSDPSAHKLVRAYGDHSHHAIARRKRGSNSKRCKARPSSSVEDAKPSSTSATPAKTTHQDAPSPTSDSGSNHSGGNSGNNGNNGNGGGNSGNSGGNSGSNSGNNGNHAGSGAKKGLAWPNGDSSDLKNFVNDKVGSLYTWSPHAPKQAKSLGLEFVPMCWGWNQVSDFQNTVKPGYANWAMGVNEPNEPGQSNMSPESGAELWKKYLEPLRSQGYKLVAPVTSGNPNGLDWVANFVKACNGGCNFDAVAVHFYDTSAEKFKNWVNAWHDAYPGKEVWVTEYACQNFNNGPQCSKSQIFSFMSEVNSWMDSQPWITRYFPFGVMNDLQGVNPLNSLMTGSGTPTDLGLLFLDQ